MYVPSHFNAPDRQAMIDLMRSYSFALLITPGESLPSISHVPLLVEEEGKELVLTGHLAGANPHWEQLEGSLSSVVFQGPHCYISPNWYVNPNVPTWNYTAVHAHGEVSLVQNNYDVRDIVEELSEIHEKELDDPWIPDYPDSMLNAIVGFRIQVTRIEGKYKLGQNKQPEDIDSVASVLRGRNSDNEHEIANLMFEL